MTSIVLVDGFDYQMFPLLEYHFIVVERSACPNNPRSSVVRNFMPLIGPPMANWGRDQTKPNPTGLLGGKTNGSLSPLPEVSYQGPLLEPGLGVGHGDAWWLDLCP